MSDKRRSDKSTRYTFDIFNCTLTQKVYNSNSSSQKKYAKIMKLCMNAVMTPLSSLKRKKKYININILLCSRIFKMGIRWIRHLITYPNPCNIGEQCVLLLFLFYFLLVPHFLGLLSTFTLLLLFQWSIKFLLLLIETKTKTKNTWSRGLLVSN